MFLSRSIICQDLSNVVLQTQQNQQHPDQVVLRDTQHLNLKHTDLIHLTFLLLGDKAHLQSVDLAFENSSRFLVICQINDNIGLYLYIWM